MRALSPGRYCDADDNSGDTVRFGTQQQVQQVAKKSFIPNTKLSSCSCGTDDIGRIVAEVVVRSLLLGLLKRICAICSVELQRKI